MCCTCRHVISCLFFKASGKHRQASSAAAGTASCICSNSWAVSPRSNCLNHLWVCNSHAHWYCDSRSLLVLAMVARVLFQTCQVSMYVPHARKCCVATRRWTTLFRSASGYVGARAQSWRLPADCACRASRCACLAAVQFAGYYCCDEPVGFNFILFASVLPPCMLP